MEPIMMQDMDVNKSSLILSTLSYSLLTSLNPFKLHAVSRWHEITIGSGAEILNLPPSLIVFRPHQNKLEGDVIAITMLFMDTMH